MKKLWQIILGVPVMLALLVTGCTVDDPDSPTNLTAPTTAEVLANYGALGNSLTAGFMDGGLIIDGQSDSYPQLIARQLGYGTGEFTQPLVDSPGIGSTKDGIPDGYVAGVLYFNGNGLSVLGVTARTDIPTLLLNATQLTPYHNMGVPGATLTDVTQAYNGDTSSAALLDPDSPNSYFDFINRADTLFGSHQETVMLPDPQGGDDIPFVYQTGSTFRQIVAKGPSLLTVWIGNNDVLGSAMAGNPITGLAPTSALEFQAKYTTLLMALAGGLLERNGWPSTIILANIPSISTIPYFIPEDFFATNVADWPWGYEEDDVALVRFPAISWVQDADNLGSPLPANYTLTTAEKAVIDGTVTGYNQIIAGVAAAIHASGAAQCGYVDMNGILAGLSTAQKTHFLFLVGSLGVDGAAATTYFSLDGIHPNNLGYGVVANAFIDKINAMLGTSVAKVVPEELSWRPTYGVTLTGKTMRGLPVIDEAAARAMDAVFR